MSKTKKSLTPALKRKDDLPDYAVMEIFGFDKKQAKEEWAQEQYATGASVFEIAAALNIQIPTVYNYLKCDPERYEKGKERRELMSGFRVTRSLGLGDRKVHDRLEDEGDDISNKELLAFVKELAHRQQLQDGKPTDITRVDREELTTEDIKALIKEQEEAGTGINVGVT